MDRIFRLIDKAGGKAFIVDKQKGKDYVIMPLDEYEDLVEDFCAEEFIDLEENFEESVEPIHELAQDHELAEDFGMPMENQHLDSTDEPAGTEEDEFYIEPLE